MRHRGQRLGLGFGQPVLCVGREDSIALAMHLTKNGSNSWFTIESMVHAKRVDASLQLVDCDKKEAPLSCRWEPSWIREEICFLWETKTHTSLDFHEDYAAMHTAVMSSRKMPLRFTEVSDNCFTMSSQEDGRFLRRRNGSVEFTDNGNSDTALWTAEKCSIFHNSHIWDQSVCLESRDVRCNHSSDLNPWYAWTLPPKMRYDGGRTVGGQTGIQVESRAYRQKPHNRHSLWNVVRRHSKADGGTVAHEHGMAKDSSGTATASFQRRNYVSSFRQLAVLAN
jgi:hypothetical protein